MNTTTIRRHVTITMTDGVELAALVYLPDTPDPAPTLFGASPYRFDNDDIPDTGIFLWRETGPIHWYVAQGYAYVHLDVRGTGRSGGEYGFFDRRERRDLYEAIEWVAQQPWCSGRIGGIGHSYYAASQWCMAAEQPPHLACIAPYDGHFDPMGGWAFPGGLPGHFINEWWNNNVRPINRHPANGVAPRALPLDLTYLVSQHPSYDDFWKDRDFAEDLARSTVPVYSIGVWAKLDLHLAGNIGGFQRMAGPKNLLVSDVLNMSGAQAEFESEAFHQRVLLPFYEHHLRQRPSGFTTRPPVQYAIRNTGEIADAQTWPPANIVFQPFYLAPGPTNSVASLNDGGLTSTPASGATSYSYPDPKWMLGQVTFGPTGPDPVRRVLTFTSDPLADDMDIAGPSELVVFLSSTAKDADLIIKLSEQLPQPDQDRTHQPKSAMVTKGWLRASLRQLDPAASQPGAPVLTLAQPDPLVPGEIYQLRVPLMPMAYRFRKASRLRIEIANADSPLTDAVFTHSYTPDRIGTDTLHHSIAHPSHLLLPVVQA